MIKGVSIGVDVVKPKIVKMKNFDTITPKPQI